MTLPKYIIIYIFTPIITCIHYDQVAGDPSVDCYDNESIILQLLCIPFFKITFFIYFFFLQQKQHDSAARGESVKKKNIEIKTSLSKTRSTAVDFNRSRDISHALHQILLFGSRIEHV